MILTTDKVIQLEILLNLYDNRVKKVYLSNLSYEELYSISELLDKLAYLKSTIEKEFDDRNNFE